MRKIFQFIIPVMAVAGLSSCYGIDEGTRMELSPIEIVAASDTINADLGIQLTYTGVTVNSELECSYEWVYGPLASGTTVADGEFASKEVISTSPTIDYTFTAIGSYLLRLQVDNGESIEFKYFTLNVNSGYDEGVCILSNDADGNGSLTFIKTLTSEEEAAGEQEVYDDVFASINPNYVLKNGTALYMSDNTVKSVDYAGLLIATNDEEGSLWHIEPKTFAMFKHTSLLSECGTWCKSIAGQYATTSNFATFLLGADKRVYRYDMLIGFVAATDISPTIEHAHASLCRTNANSASTRVGFFFNADSVFCRYAASGGVRTQMVEDYEVVNVASRRTGAAASNLTLLFRSKSDPTQYSIWTSSAAASSSALRSKSELTTFTAADLKMDSDSKFVNTKNSSDVYYTYDNAIYRWSLVSAPGTRPAITAPEGETIRDIAVNFKGTARGDDGEDLLYVVTYNPNRSGEKKGSLYVYRFSDETLVKSYEGIFYDPVSVLYKYRLN